MSTPSLAELRNQLTKAESDLAALKSHIAALQQQIAAHPDEIAAVAARERQQIDKVFERFSQDAEKAKWTNYEATFLKFKESLTTVPRFVQFPIRLRTKYYMPDADGTVSAVYFLWNDKPVFLANAEFNGIWSNDSEDLGFAFTKHNFDYEYDEMKDFPKDLAKFLPSDKETSKDFWIDFTDFDNDIRNAVGDDVNEGSFLAVVGGLGGSFDDLESMLSYLDEILPHYERVGESGDGDNREEEGDCDSDNDDNEGGSAKKRKTL
ncbi:hypothetical protein HDU76_004194 [Blyttiomyces sp. JEL0837]|nr:hypothetical protein HDU76_004194 [Blyttiomyces sp. JEL0837]